MAITPEQKSSFLFKNFFNRGETRFSRNYFEEPINAARTINPSHIWTYGNLIPDGTDETGGEEAIEKIKHLSAAEPNFIYEKSEDDLIPIVRRYFDVQLCKIDNGTDNAFVVKDENGEICTHIIPYNFYEDVYNYELKTEDGHKIVYGAGDWLLDTYSGILTFYGKVPTGVDHEHPPVLSFYRYVGGVGFRHDRPGYEGAIIALNEIQNTRNVPIIKGVYQKVLEATDRVIPDFLKTFKFDGADDNEGLALSFEKLCPVVYHDTKDAVLALEKDSQVMSLMTNKVCSFNGANFLTFATHSTPNGHHAIYIQGDNVSLDNGPATKVGRGVKVTCGDYFVIGNFDALTDGHYDFDVSESDEKLDIALLYFDIEAQDYLPYIPDEDAVYDTSFPIVTEIGKIPASIKLGINDLTVNRDTITPDYYGPRTYAVVFARYDGINIKSADYLIRNTDGNCVHDILNTLPWTTGTVFFRTGTYRIGKIDWDKFSSLTFDGEDGVTLDIEDAFDITIPVTFKNIKLNFVNVDHLKVKSDVTFENISTNLQEIAQTDGTLTIKDCEAERCDLTLLSGMSHVSNSKLHDVTLTSDEFSFFSGSKFNYVAISAPHSIFTSSYIEELDVSAVDDVNISGNIIKVLNSKPTALFLDENYITQYDSSIPAEDHPYDESFPIWLSATKRVYTKIKAGIPYFYDKANNEWSFRWDPDRIVVLDDGRLSHRVTVRHVLLDQEGINQMIRQPTSEGLEVPALDVPDISRDENGNPYFKYLYDFLADLYWSKADLKEGKVPLQQLPDSVAYGGVHFVGMWNFEDSNGQYPKFEDILEIQQRYTKDNEVYELQPGWFFIVSASHHPGRPADDQLTIDGVKYTAGDWGIWTGTKWDKLDRAYQEAAFGLMPNLVPNEDGNDLPWYYLDGGNGAVDLADITIAKAFDRLNTAIHKLAPKKPLPISYIYPKIETEYPTTNYRLMTTANMPSETVKTSWDMTQIGGDKFKVDFSMDGHSRRDCFFTGDEADVAFRINDKNELSAHIKIDTTVSKSNSKSHLMVDATHDAYDNDYDIYGKEEFWKSTMLTADSTFDKEGDYKVNFTVKNMQPTIENEKFNTASPYVAFSFIRPYKAENPRLQNVVMNESEMDTALRENRCSGIFKMPTNFTYKFRFRIADLFNRVMPENFRVPELFNDYDDQVIPVTNYSFYKSSVDPVHGQLYGLLVTNLMHTTQDKGVECHHITWYIRSFDYYGNPHEEQLDRIDFIINDCHESERCTSGEGFYPLTFGGPFDSSLRVKYDNIYELMKAEYVRPDGTLGFRYSWPDGKHVYKHNQHREVDYEFSDNGLQVAPGQYYRFATFKLDNIFEASGYEITIETDNPELYDTDLYTGATTDMILQTCVVGPDKRTAWFDANSPVDGFRYVMDGSPNGASVMFAGESTGNVKRVSFGKSTFSGDVYVRIGLKAHTERTFTRIYLSKVI